MLLLSLPLITAFQDVYYVSCSGLEAQLRERLSSNFGLTQGCNF